MSTIKITARPDGRFDGEFFGANSRKPTATLEFSESLGGFVGVGQPPNGRFLKPATNIDLLAVMMRPGESMDIEVFIEGVIDPMQFERIR